MKHWFKPVKLIALFIGDDSMGWAASVIVVKNIVGSNWEICHSLEPTTTKFGNIPTVAGFAI